VVYFTRNLSADGLIAAYEKVAGEIGGHVGVKLHTGEQNGPNIIPREWVKALMEKDLADATIIETNTYYEGDRYTTDLHRKTLEVNGWTFCPVDMLDEEGDVALPVRNGLRLKEVHMGGHLTNYDSLIVLTHFKGHAMGGFGGSMKNIAIGCASGQVGKREVHLVVDDMPANFEEWPMKEQFMETMADSAKATCDYFGKHIVFLNVMRRMSVDCDCAGVAAEEPTIADIGICASTDILAIDQACCDMVFTKPEGDQKDLVERITSRHGLHQLTAMQKQKMGNPQYELIEVE
jgi:uncharacterized Fe-S center protein